MDEVVRATKLAHIHDDIVSGAIKKANPEAGFF